MKNHVTNPHHLSPESWEKGYRDHQIAVEVDTLGCNELAYDGLLAERERLFDELAAMDGPALRAYIDGMHSHMGEHFI